MIVVHIRAMRYEQDLVSFTSHLFSLFKNTGSSQYVRVSTGGIILYEVEKTQKKMMMA
jgi:hypothetical protein